MATTAHPFSLLLITALLAGCGGAPVTETAPASPAVAQAEDPDDRSGATGPRHLWAAPGKQYYSRVFEGRYVLNYEVDTRYSSIDKVSCYAFLTGTLTNNAPHTLSRQSRLEFQIYHADKLLFRDYTHLRRDLGPGSRVQFTFVESPLHLKHCPSYDRIDVALNKIVLR
jgi:hypothetical protein